MARIRRRKLKARVATGISGLRTALTDIEKDDTRPLVMVHRLADPPGIEARYTIVWVEIEIEVVP